MRFYLSILCILTIEASFQPRRIWAVETVESNARIPATDQELRRWLENMVWHHHFTTDEITAATGLAAEQVQAALVKFDIRAETRPAADRNAPLLVLPYPGGRHPRIGFLDGAIQPQRETKVSVFVPWNDAHYVVLDIPEAIWCENRGERELLYLAHTHIPTTWTKQRIELEPTEWQVDPQGVRMERKLPNGVVFGTLVRPERNHVIMEMWLSNGTA